VEPCLEAIEENTVGEHEVILVDNGTNDNTKFQDVGFVDKYIRINNEGVMSRNYGRLIARGDYILNVDDDVIVHPGWDETLIDFINIHEGVVASGQMGFLAYPDLSNFNRVPRTQGQFCDFITGFCWAYRNTGMNFRNDLLPWDWFTPDGKPSALHDETWIQCLMRLQGGKFIVSPIVSTHNSQRSNVDFSDDADKIKLIQDSFCNIEYLHLEKE
jgi:glycosyltransferase involved in cell wall biosynthesis